MHIFPSSSIFGISNSFIYLSIYFAEFFLYRIVFLVLGMVMLMLAFFLSKSLVFYYTSAMAIGVLLVILMVLFQVVWYLWFSNINVYIYKYIFVIQVFFSVQIIKHVKFFYFIVVSFSLFMLGLYFMIVDE